MNKSWRSFCHGDQDQVKEGVTMLLADLRAAGPDSTRWSTETTETIRGALNAVILCLGYPPYAKGTPAATLKARADWFLAHSENAARAKCLDHIHALMNLADKAHSILLRFNKDDKDEALRTIAAINARVEIIKPKANARGRGVCYVDQFTAGHVFEVVPSKADTDREIQLALMEAQDLAIVIVFPYLLRPLLDAYDLPKEAQKEMLTFASEVVHYASRLTRGKSDRRTGELPTLVAELNRHVDNAPVSHRNPEGGLKGFGDNLKNLALAINERVFPAFGQLSSSLKAKAKAKAASLHPSPAPTPAPARPPSDRDEEFRAKTEHTKKLVDAELTTLQERLGQQGDKRQFDSFLVYYLAVCAVLRKSQPKKVFFENKYRSSAAMAESEYSNAMTQFRQWKRWASGIVDPKQVAHDIDLATKWYIDAHGHRPIPRDTPLPRNCSQRMPEKLHGIEPLSFEKYHTESGPMSYVAEQAQREEIAAFKPTVKRHAGETDGQWKLRLADMHSGLSKSLGFNHWKTKLVRKLEERLQI